MADPEKLTALKKAYADTILNTAKEAAARVMVSERKARGYQQELVAVRDDALRTLLRLKHMFDSKVKETEIISLRQQKKIEELEAQLGEAEDIVEELRMELQELQDELEKVTNSQMHCHDEESPCWEDGEAVGSLPEDNSSHERLEVRGSSGPVGQSGSVVACGIKNPFLNGKDNISRCTYSNNGDVCHHNLPSILTRHKEAKAFNEGCSQLIHALERNMANTDLSAPKQADDIKDEVFLVEEKETASAVISPHSEQNKVPFDRSSSNQSVETLAVSDCSDVSDSPSSDDDDAIDGEDAQVSQNSQKNSDSSMSLITLSSVRESDRKSLIGITESGKEENGNDENLELAVSVLCEESADSPADKRCIKYTFKRKRRKDSLSSPDRDFSQEESGTTKKQKTGEKDNGYLESLKSSLITESSRDSRRVAQVARQLVSLSEKKGLQKNGFDDSLMRK